MTREGDTRVLADNIAGVPNRRSRASDGPLEREDRMKSVTSVDSKKDRLAFDAA